MTRKAYFAFLFTIAFLGGFGSGPSLCEETTGAKKAVEDQANLGRGLPAEVVTSHTILLAGETLAFTARAGAIGLRDPQSGALQAEVSVVSYERAGAEPNLRPLIFVFNGGPGASSAWLGLGAISPWRIPLENEAISPSMSPQVVDNAETWLAFADLVFIDPPGVGYSKVFSDSEDVRKHFYSVQGDVETLSVAIRKWLTNHRRLDSPKYLAGESYGGFRVIKLARALSERESVGVKGLILISPVLDFSWLESSRNLLSFAGYLPSFAAISRSAKNRTDLADVETYAGGEYVSDLLKGVKDAAAVSRLSTNVARITGLNRDTVARLAGRVDPRTFTRERLQTSGRVLSSYDGDLAGFDPNPFSHDSDWADPVLDSLRAPLGEAMIKIVTEKLKWPIGDARFEILNDQIAHRWDFGRGGRQNAEAVSDLRQALALDPHLTVAVVHGLSDLVTPYFATKLQLDQLPAYGDAVRVQLTVLRGGHMSYLHDDSRKLLRDVAQRLFETK